MQIISIDSERYGMFESDIVAYFAMGNTASPRLPSLAGGLEILAGDHTKSAAEMKIPLVGVNLLCKNGYFGQRIVDGRQVECYDTPYDPREYTEQVPESVTVEIEGRSVRVNGWLSRVKHDGFEVPIYLLDTDTHDNNPIDRPITNNIYLGDSYHRLRQEIVLGIGGMRMLRERGIEPKVVHLNDCHPALACLENGSERTVFTNHTLTPAGQDVFDPELVDHVMGREMAERARKLTGEDVLDMTRLAHRESTYTNGVSRLHGSLLREAFKDPEIGYITNGVHHTWASPPFQDLFDKELPGWRGDSSILQGARDLSTEDLLRAHRIAKMYLVNDVNAHSCTGSEFDYGTLTIGIARRADPYKRLDLILTDLRKLVDSVPGRVQILYAAKAHPDNEKGKELIHKLLCTAETIEDETNGNIRIGFLSNYNRGIAQSMVAGSDVWLSTPVCTLEACQTSGMKAAFNGVSQISILDGWWPEAEYDGRTMGGWSFGPDPSGFTLDQRNDLQDADALYRVLPIASMECADPGQYAERMREAIGFNASRFSSSRMLDEYVRKKYFPE
jgi:starch phosphorylase